jgi:hypothetical protein
MSKFLLEDVKVVVAGVDLSGHAFNVDTPSVKAQVDVSGFNPNGTMEFLPGLADQTITIQFHNDFAAAQVHATLWPLYQSGTGFIIWLQPDSNSGTSAVNPIYGGSATLYEYNGLSGALNAPADTTATFKPAPNASFSWGTSVPT